jgi:hypothetical protein
MEAPGVAQEDENKNKMYRYKQREIQPECSL